MFDQFQPLIIFFGGLIQNIQRSRFGTKYSGNSKMVLSCFDKAIIDPCRKIGLEQCGNKKAAGMGFRSTDLPM